MQTINVTPALHRRALDEVGALVARIGPADLDRPTPCTGWDLRQLLAHMIGQNHGFAAAARADVGVEAFADRPVAYDVDRAWAASADAVAEGLAAALAEDRTVLLAEFAAFGRIPARLVLGMHLLDSVVHGWDVATALGDEHRPDDELVAATLAQAELVPAGRSREQPDAVFGPVVAGDSDDPWARALRLLGRDPGHARASRS